MAGLEVRLNGRGVPLKQVGQVELAMPFRKHYRFEVPHPPGWEDGAEFEWHNDNYLDLSGRIVIEVDPCSVADITYDSRWDQAEDDLGPIGVDGTVDSRERDIVFRYRRGTGRYELPDEFADDPAGGQQTAGPVDGESSGEWGGAYIAAAGAAGAVSLLVFFVGWARGAALVRRVSTAAVVGVLAACLVGWPGVGLARRWLPEVVAPPDVQAAQIFQSLHRGIYRAFEARTESQAYDALAASLQGRALDEAYNEVYEALMMRKGGAARFSVRRVKPIATRVLPAGDVGPSAFRVLYRWRVYGTVTHFGHTHARFNEYEARYVVRHNGRTWRIADTEVRQHKRVTLGKS